MCDTANATLIYWVYIALVPLLYQALGLDKVICNANKYLRSTLFDTCQILQPLEDDRIKGRTLPMRPSPE